MQKLIKHTSIRKCRKKINVQGNRKMSIWLVIIEEDNLWWFIISRVIEWCQSVFQDGLNMNLCLNSLNRGTDSYAASIFAWTLTGWMPRSFASARMKGLLYSRRGRCYTKSA